MVNTVVVVFLKISKIFLMPHSFLSRTDNFFIELSILKVNMHRAVDMHRSSDKRDESFHILLPCP